MLVYWLLLIYPLAKTVSFSCVCIRSLPKPDSLDALIYSMPKDAHFDCVYQIPLPKTAPSRHVYILAKDAPFRHIYIYLSPKSCLLSCAYTPYQNRTLRACLYTSFTEAALRSVYLPLTKASSFGWLYLLCVMC